MIKYFIVLILVFSNDIFSLENIKIYLENSNNSLRLYLVNYGGEVLINKRFSIGNNATTYDVRLEIIDKEKKKYIYGPLDKEREIEESDIVFLWPCDIVGREYNINILVSSYDLVPGKYEARATYRNVHWLGKGVYGERLMSDWTTFEVTEEDMKNAYGKNWGKIYQDAFERQRKILTSKHEMEGSTVSLAENMNSLYETIELDSEAAIELASKIKTLCNITGLINYDPLPECDKFNVMGRIGYDCRTMLQIPGKGPILYSLTLDKHKNVIEFTPFPNQLNLYEYQDDFDLLLPGKERQKVLDRINSINFKLGYKYFGEPEVKKAGRYYWVKCKSSTSEEIKKRSERELGFIFNYYLTEEMIVFGKWNAKQ